MGWGYSDYGFRPYVSVAQRRANGLREATKLAKKGQKLMPVKVEGRKISQSVWGQGWCEHLESYSDFANRLPRGRTYVRNGSVLDLKIKPGRIEALVMGSELYTIKIKIAPLKKDRWQALQQKCSGKIKSVLELLKGGVSAGVMEVMSHRERGMFPSPKEIDMDCSCPDWAGMCKHLAAVLYGIGARLDAQPELLFTLRDVDPAELVARATEALSMPVDTAGTIAEAELADVFGIDLVSAGALAEIAKGAAAIGMVPLKGGKSLGKESPANTKARSRKAKARRMPRKGASRATRPSVVGS